MMHTREHGKTCACIPNGKSPIFSCVRWNQPDTWSHVKVHWNATLVQTYVNSSLCGSVESGYGTSGDPGWGTGNNNVELRDSLLVGAWRGVPDDPMNDGIDGFFTGLIDNLEVCILQAHDAGRQNLTKCNYYDLIYPYTCCKDIEICTLSSPRSMFPRWQTKLCASPFILPSTKLLCFNSSRRPSNLPNVLLSYGLRAMYTEIVIPEPRPRAPKRAWLPCGDSTKAAERWQSTPPPGVGEASRRWEQFLPQSLWTQVHCRLLTQGEMKTPVLVWNA